MDKEKKRYPTKISLILRIAVSAYLLYIVWELRGAPASHTGGARIFFIAAMIVFAVVAVVLGGFSLRAFLNGEYDRPEED
ncbi:MAG: hypothetical protein KH452_12340 [Clostridiales bacterium]|nr:hypothetical protein [Clostridiales bacterium]